MFAKSLISQGRGKAMVIAVGRNTTAGMIGECIYIENEPTMLQKKLIIIAEKIGYLGIWCAVLTFISLIIRVAFEMLDFIPCGCINLLDCQRDKDCIEYSFSPGNRLWMDILNTIIIAISVIVCAIPEGLPLAVTISLSYASR